MIVNTICPLSEDGNVICDCCSVCFERGSVDNAEKNLNLTPRACLRFQLPLFPKGHTFVTGPKDRSAPPPNPSAFSPGVLWHL